MHNFVLLQFFKGFTDRVQRPEKKLEPWAGRAGPGRAGILDTTAGRAGPTNLPDGLFVGPSHSEDTTVPTVVPYRTPERRTGDVGKGAASVFFFCSTMVCLLVQEQNAAICSE